MTRETTPSSRRGDRHREPLPSAATRQCHLGGVARRQRLLQSSPGCRRYAHGGYRRRAAVARRRDHDPDSRPIARGPRPATVGPTGEGAVGLETPACGRGKLASRYRGRRRSGGGWHPPARGDPRAAGQGVDRLVSAGGTSDVRAWPFAGRRTSRRSSPIAAAGGGDRRRGLHSVPYPARLAARLALPGKPSFGYDTCPVRRQSSMAPSRRRADPRWHLKATDNGRRGPALDRTGSRDVPAPVAGRPERLGGDGRGRARCFAARLVVLGFAAYPAEMPGPVAGGAPGAGDLREHGPGRAEDRPRRDS